jgi:uncharacterized protein YceK
LNEVIMRRTLFVLACVSALPSGCMSALNHTHFMGNPPDERPYGGVRTNAEWIGENATSAARGQVKDARELAGMTFMTMLCVIDLPLSAVADTFWLPHDIRVTCEKRDRPPVEPTQEAVNNSEK